MFDGKNLTNLDHFESKLSRINFLFATSLKFGLLMINFNPNKQR